MVGIHNLMLWGAVLFGLVIGSFLNVLIYRLPAKKSILNPGSSCPQCGTPIKFYHNIPLLSYLLLMGRCRHCRQPIAWHYPVVEGLTGLLSLALFIRWGPSLQYFLLFLFAAALVVISFIDLKHRIIPDVISLPGMAAGLGASFFLAHTSWLDSLIGLLAGGGSLYLIAVIYQWITGREGMGGGDIKMLGMIGAWMGCWSLPLIVLLSSLSGALMGGTYLLAAGRGYRFRIPFGPFLALGTLLYLFFGIRITYWYYGILH